MLNKKTVLTCLAVLALTLTAVAWAGEAPSAETASAESGVYGEGLKLKDVTPIAKIVQDPEAFAGKVVRVEGKVTGVCAMMGCWIELTSKEDDTIRVKVEHGVIAFPKESKGSWAAAEGEVTTREMTREQWAARLRHEAEERGETYDDSEVGDGPFKVVQIQGTGAEIQAAK